MFKQNKINRIEPLQIPLTNIRQEGQKHPRPLGKLVKPLRCKGGFLFIEAKKAQYFLTFALLNMMSLLRSLIITNIILQKKIKIAYLN